MSRGFGSRGSRRPDLTRNLTSTGRSRAETPPPPPFGPTIDSISSRAVLVEEDAPTIQDAEYIASYNWLQGKSPIILVPGQYCFRICICI
jgi:hypothetical protein